MKFIYQFRGLLTFLGLDFAIGGYHDSWSRVGGGFLVGVVVIAVGAKVNE